MPEINMIASSGGTNTSPDGSVFYVDFDDSMKIPSIARNVTLSADNATIWWTIPNIIAGLNDKMYITGPDTLGVVQNFTVQIPQGLYDLAGLESAIHRSLENQGAKIDPEPLVSLSPDEATQRVEIRLNYSTVVVDFTQIQTPRIILGYEPIVLAYPTIRHIAANNAAFNQVSYFLIHSDLVSQGIRFNNSYTQTIMQVPITVSPGSQIVSTPYNPPRIDASNLIGATRNRVKFWLTDQEGRQVNTNGELWSVRLVIRFEEYNVYRLNKQNNDAKMYAIANVVHGSTSERA